MSAHSAQQARTLRESLSQSQDDRSRILSEKEAHNDQMSDKLIQMEGQLTQLRTEAAQAQVLANGLCVSHVEELSIDLNRQSNVDKEPLAQARVKRAEL